MFCVYFSDVVAHRGTTNPPKTVVYVQLCRSYRMRCTVVVLWFNTIMFIVRDFGSMHINDVSFVRRFCVDKYSAKMCFRCAKKKIKNERRPPILVRVMITQHKEVAVRYKTYWNDNRTGYHSNRPT